MDLGLFTKDQSFMEIGVILADVHITYLEPVYFGQKIKVGVHVAKLGNKSMTWEQNIVDSCERRTRRLCRLGADDHSVRHSGLRTSNRRLPARVRGAEHEQHHADGL